MSSTLQQAAQKASALRAALERLGGPQAAAELDRVGRRRSAEEAAQEAQSRQERRIAAALAQRAATARAHPAIPASPRKHDRHVAALAKRQKRDARWLATHRQRCAERGMVAPSPAAPVHVWDLISDILSDPSGRAVRIHVGRARNVVALGALRLAALGLDAHGYPRRSFASAYARHVFALGLSMLQLCADTKRKGRYRSVVRGFTFGAWLAMLRDPWTGKQLHQNTLSGRHRSWASLERSQLGYLDALREAGFLYWQQLPGNDPEVAPWERYQTDRGPRSSLRYWIVTDDAHDGHLFDRVRARLQELERLGAELSELMPGPPTRRAAPTPASAAPS